MIPTYVPLLKALKSEFKAVEKLTSLGSDKICPLFDVARIGKNITEAKRFAGCPELTTAYLNEVVSGIASVWSGRTAMVDLYHWMPNAKIESGEHVVPYVYSVLDTLGVSVIPVVGYDRWDNDEYRMAIQAIDFPADRDYCIRLDSTAIEDAAEPDFFLENIVAIVEGLEIEPSRCCVLIDFSDATSTSVEFMLSRSAEILEILSDLGFNYYVTAGCSLPKSINEAVSKPDSTGTVIRREMVLWQALRELMPKVKIVYGDYGVRGPNTNEGVISTHTNGKIRYTINKQFFIVRGHSMQLPGKGAQMYTLARILMASSHYMGEPFSWGDFQVGECSRQKIKGGAPQWITIDTNHHLVYAVAEVEEFERVLARRIAFSTDS
ncbi:hypothetical protein ACS77_00430 [Pseudomonas syringae]|uniref:Beta protein n=1 Tax=Pseudomonas syringae TaxID=317 RepID=A0A0L1MP72_PSESX|nr:beta family protein [Pseudomonas sp. BF-R-26]KNH30317.1 hypothetical protein ACS77_00430 [Pseudomonas syringae]